jgi:hypothetical protein
MDHKILKGHNHILWPKSLKHRQRSWNGMNIAILPENPLWQVKAHHRTVGHDPTRVPTYVMERHEILLILVRSPYDISIHHQINQASVMSKIIMAPRQFPSGSKRVSTIVVLHKIPRKELLEVLQNSSLQTQRDIIISTQVSYKQIFQHHKRINKHNNIVSHL